MSKIYLDHCNDINVIKNMPIPNLITPYLDPLLPLFAAAANASGVLVIIVKSVCPTISYDVLIKIYPLEICCLFR